ncbi:MAG: type I glyceraldehyde-3-phosphate dehydrogenase [Candidatus Thorarchaeota archaeon]|nr:MAG: type I glyceraldehyde-3-phosphate dehydrogenase [Candidatus Thorarchaeota archaeon]
MARVAINGFGRTGRQFMRQVLAKKNLEVVAINDLTDAKTLAHLFKYDTAMRQFNGTVTATKDGIVINGKEIKILSEKDPTKLPWKQMAIDIVIESTGVFRDTADCQKHVAAGAKKVILTAPAKGEMPTFVMGVNESTYDPAKHHIVSNASCTTNCLAPMVKIVDEAFAIVKGMMTTVHAVTNDQRLLDLQHTDLRRARAAAWNIVPTSTGAAKAIGLVYPKAKDKMNGIAIRVPVLDVSLTDLSVVVQKPATVETVNAAFKKAADGAMKPYLRYTDEELVSSDFIGDTHSCIFDSLQTMIVGDMVKVLGWYDNELGYSTRLTDLASFMAQKL